jgi:predicted acetyltransferase
MTDRPADLLPSVAVISAGPEQQQTLANLLELYVHDFSEFCRIEVGPDGRFGYDRLPLYWSEPNRHPFLVRIDGNLAGLVFVKRRSEIYGDATVWDMAEFFVLRGYRRRGLGTEVAHQVWKQFPGPWEIRVMNTNVLALSFWSNAIAKFTGKAIRPTCIERDAQSLLLFSFESPGLSI